MKSRSDIARGEDQQLIEPTVGPTLSECSSKSPMHGEIAMEFTMTAKLDTI